MSETVPESEKRRVRNIMTTDVVKAYPDTPVNQIARLMSDLQISGLPVVDDNDQVLGVITELDMILRNTRFKMPTFFTILDSIIYLERPSHVRKRLENMLGTTAREIMSSPAFTVTPESTLEELAELMVERRMNPIPVIEANRLVGIVSRSDIIRLMAQEFGGDES